MSLASSAERIIAKLSPDQVVQLKDFTVFRTLLTPVYTAIKARASNHYALSLWLETIIHYKRRDSIRVLLTDVRM